MVRYTGHSELGDVKEALNAACRDFIDTHPQLIVFFSDGDRFAEMTQELNKMFPDSTIIGASSFISFYEEGYSKRGICIAALEGDIRAAAGLIREISRNTGDIYQNEITATLNEFGIDDCRSDNTCCFVLNPAGTSCEEFILDTLMNVMRNLNIPVVGGAASSEKFINGAVSLNGNVYYNSTVYTLIHLNKGIINISLENIFRPMGKEYLVTEVDPESRILYSLNGEPAAAVLCRDLGISRDELPAALTRHPFGRVPNKKLFINEIDSVNDDGSISTFCRIQKQSKIVLLEPCELEQTMDQTWARLHEEMPVIDFSIMINCYSRVQMYLNNGWMDRFAQRTGKELDAVIGFTSHGEFLGDFLLNLSMLIVSFGEAEEDEREQV
jgi:hypothetical protein